MLHARAGVVVLAAACLIASGSLAAAYGSEASPTWDRAASMSQRRSYFAAAELAGSIYAAGGMVGETGRPLATFARYDALADGWSVLPPLPVPTRAAAGAALDGRVYVVGGTTAAGNTSATFEFDTSSRRWSRKAPLPAPRFNHSAVSLNGRLYVLGGLAAGVERTEVFAYDPRADRWRLATELPRPMHAFGAVAFDGELWVLGGRSGETVLRDVWILDPRTVEWRRGPAMPKPMELLGAAVVDDRIHAIWESLHQVYDHTFERWTQAPPPRVTRHALEAFVVDDSLYAVGGCTTSLKDTQVVERFRLP